MQHIEPTENETTFITAYFEAVDFTETGDTDQPEPGAELDEDFIRESIVDCMSFFSRIACYLSDDQVTHAGHDFWLTRNGHGAGFWDGDCTAYGEMFTKISTGYGEVHAMFEQIV
jgi:hypothetical protein